MSAKENVKFKDMAKGDKVRDDRTSHQQRTTQHGREDSWTWEEILDGKGPWRQAGEYRHPREELEAVKAERQRYEGTRLARKPERQPPQLFGEGHTGSVAESGIRPEPTPRAYRGEHVTGQARAMGGCALCLG